MRVTLCLELPDALQDELQRAARASGITAPAWAALAIEAELATRRLPHVRLGQQGPRIVARATEDTEPDGYRVVCPERSYNDGRGW